MADYGGAVAGNATSRATLYSSITTNWQDASAGTNGQTSIHCKTWVQRSSTGGTLFSGGASWSSNYGGNGRSGGFSYSLGNNASMTLDEYDQTFNHDGNGDLGIGGGASVNMNNPGWLTTGSTSVAFYPGRLARAPSNGVPAASNVSVVSATITASVSTWGNGSAHGTPYDIRYRVQGGGAWTERGFGAATWDITGLTPGAIYEMGMRARNNNGDTSNWTSGTYTFTTLPAPSTSAALLGIIGVF